MSQLKNLSEESKQEAQEFLKIAFDFKLGDLPTEQPAPETMGLSDKCQTDIKEAINMVRNLDLKTIDILKNKVNAGEIKGLYDTITKTLDQGHRIFICGCGATGRLSLALESLWRQEVRHQFKDSDPEQFQNLENRVVSFMAGGDAALIKSVEDFEDHPEFAVQHAKDLGFTSNDLMIGSSEGGETPWVIGAVEYAAQICDKEPWYLYCNPDDILIKTVERSKRIIEDKRVHKINLCVGNQAITGSTRMQCTTILMYAIGLALLSYYKIVRNSENQQIISKEEQDASFQSKISAQVENFEIFYQNFDEVNFLAPYTLQESEIYKNKDFIFYDTDFYFSLCILTDTTERSPTFSLHPFENQLDQVKEPALCHLVMLQKDNQIQLKEYNEKQVRESWNIMLGFRDIRGLEGKYWEKYAQKVSTARALGQDFSNNILTQRRNYCRDGKANHYHFLVQKNYENQKLEFTLSPDSENKQKDTQQIISNQIDMSVFENRRLDENMFLKILLNKHSTLVMGRLDKIKSNLMSWVRPSNNKLIDRAIRYIQHLLVFYKDKYIGDKQDVLDQIDYSVICHALYSEIEQLKYGEAIVLKTVARIIKDYFDVEIQI